MHDTIVATRLDSLDRRVESLDHRVESLDHRVERIEQFLPTLATKDELRRAVAPLATREELHLVEASLRRAMADEREEVLRHMRVLLEAHHGDIQILAEHVSALMSERRKH